MLNIPFFRRTSETFGLDIGSSAVKVVALRPTGGGYRLAALAASPLPVDAIADGAIKDPPTVVDAIKEAVERAGLGSKEAAIGLSGREIIIKTVQIPEVPAKELPDAVQLEAEHHIPFAIDEVFLDHHVVGRREGVLDLILVAVKRSKVIDYAGVVEEAGLNPVVVDLDGFAIGNQFELSHPGDTGEAVALIDIGASVMKTSVLRHGTPIFARDIPFGGNSFTQAIAQQLGLPFDRAETAKLGADVGVPWESLVPVLEAVSRELSLEVQRTFDYFASTAESERIGRIALGGGASRMPGLTEYLSSTWGIPVDVMNPFERIEVGPDHAEEVANAGAALAVAVGLGLRRRGDKPA
jgi:type IV pilus assembly protein PilM